MSAFKTNLDHLRAGNKKSKGLAHSKGFECGRSSRSAKQQSRPYVWLPYPPDNQPVPEIALEYPGEAGHTVIPIRLPGLGRGLPALKLVVQCRSELSDTLKYILALRNLLPVPGVKSSPSELDAKPIKVNISAMPPVKERLPRREAIPRAVQHEVWQRDGEGSVSNAAQERIFASIT